MNLHARGSICLSLHGEEYEIALPALFLSGDLPHSAQAQYKGDLTIQCKETGLAVCLTFPAAATSNAASKPGVASTGRMELRGTIEHHSISALAAAGGGSVVCGGRSASDSSINRSRVSEALRGLQPLVGGSNAAAAGGGGGGGGKGTLVLGSIRGYLTGVVQAVCPDVVSEWCRG